MAYTAPTATEFKARFPAFAAVADITVEAAIAEASMQVDDTWIDEANYRLGMMLYAAHTLTLDGFGPSVEAKLYAEGLSGFNRIQSGRLSVAKEGGSESAGLPVILQTQYGRRFADLAFQNCGGPRVANGAS